MATTSWRARRVTPPIPRRWRCYAQACAAAWSSSPLCDAPRFAGHLLAALGAMWEHRRSA
jgi:hypothetical protein